MEIHDLFEKVLVKKRTDTHLNLLRQIKTSWMISAGTLVLTVTDTPTLFGHCEDDHCGLCEEPVKVSGRYIIMREKCLTLMCIQRGCSSKGQITVVGSNSLILLETAECSAFLWFICSAKLTEQWWNVYIDRDKVPYLSWCNPQCVYSSPCS